MVYNASNTRTPLKRIKPTILSGCGKKVAHGRRLLSLATQQEDPALTPTECFRRIGKATTFGAVAG